MTSYKNKEENGNTKREEPEIDFPPGGRLPTNKWFWIVIVAVILLGVIFKR
jgi:hypothetical protein